jgi:predicted DNA-binding transcriptional regulator AlpA
MESEVIQVVVGGSSVVTALRPLAVDADDAAKMLGISRATFDRLASADRLPASIRFGERLPRWSVARLEKWLALGAPPREQFERLAREK